MTTTTKSRSSKATAGSDAARVDVYQQVTDRVMAALEAGTVPWRKPWDVNVGMPLSLSTRKPYRGANVLLLGLAAQMKHYASPWWGTYKAIMDHGGKVHTATYAGRRCRECGGALDNLMPDGVRPSFGTCATCHGSLDTRRPGVREKATHVIFWKTFVPKEPDPTTGKPVTRMVLRSYAVFNSEQAEWTEGKKPVVPDYSARTDADRIEAAEAIVAGYPKAPTVRTGSAAYYQGKIDTVTMPPFKAFANPELYYSTLFHELTHSTGHDDRLKRPGIVDFDHFGSDRYGKEELVAEMGAALLSGLCGFTVAETFDESASYLQSWLEALRGDRKLVVLAAAAAQKAADHILNVTFEDKSEATGSEA